MDHETRQAFDELRGETRKGFEKIDHCFELNQAEHARTRREIVEVREEIAEVREEVSALRQEFHRFRDWATAQIVELRSAVRDLSARFELFSHGRH